MSKVCMPSTCPASRRYRSMGRRACTGRPVVMPVRYKAKSRPAWKWDVQNNQDGAWIGAVNAGIEFHLRDEHYRRPLNTNFYHQQPLLMPASWSNDGQGGIRLRRERENYLAQGYSGARTMKAGETLHYNFVLRVTPFKTIDPPAHFAERFFHKYADLDAIKADGANEVNIKHATPMTPWINYP